MYDEVVFLHQLLASKSQSIRLRRKKELGHECLGGLGLERKRTGTVATEQWGGKQSIPIQSASHHEPQDVKRTDPLIRNISRASTAVYSQRLFPWIFVWRR